MNHGLMTIERYIMETQKKYPEARGHLSKVLMDLSFAAKVISAEVRKAGLVEVLGVTGDTNVHGEEVQKLDEYANAVLKTVLSGTGLISALASEEEEFSVNVTKETSGEYMVNFDPLDGSSNIDVNGSIGTIFSVLRHPRPGDLGRDEDLMQPGYRQVAAGYVLYGSSTMMVYSSGDGTHGFTLDPNIGEFLLSHPNMKIPQKGKYYSCNEAYEDFWTPGIKDYIAAQKSEPKEGEKRKSLRYIGSLVADFHRTLLKGGIFLYPADERNPSGKLRLLYEANPLAYLTEQAGGLAYVDANTRVMEVDPDGLHARVPLLMGSPDNMNELFDYMKKYN